MESQRFDALSRSLATAGSRRRLLRLLSTLPLAGWFLGPDDSAAKPGRKRQRQHRQHQHHHATAQRRHDRRQDHRHDTRSEACIPTGQVCPSKKPRGKKGKKLGCEKCCQGRFTIEAPGKKVCSCQPNGESCTADSASACCSGYCDGSICQIPPSAPCGDRTCAGCCASGVCQPGTSATACGVGGDGCATCSGTTPICQNHTCVACTSTSQCPANTLCDASGACLACDVTCPSSPCGNLVQAAITTHPAQTVFRVCAGTYVGNITTSRDLTLLGAGEGADDATNTILQGTGGTSVVRIESPTTLQNVTLRDLRITGGDASHHYGGGVYYLGDVLTMTDCTVTGNAAKFGGGGIIIAFGLAVVLTRCTITNNQATDGIGGGIATAGQTTLTDCVVAGNTAANLGGGIYVYGGSLTLNTTRVGGPTPTEANHANGPGGTPGGGIYLFGAVVNPTNASVVCGNVPDQCGPASFSDPACQTTCPPP